MTAQQQSWTTTTANVGTNNEHNKWSRRRSASSPSSVHVCMAAITLAFMGGVAVGINGWLPMRRVSVAEVAKRDVISASTRISAESSHPVLAAASNVLVAERSSFGMLMRRRHPWWNASSLLENKDGGAGRNGSTSGRPGRRWRTTSSRTTPVDLTLPEAIISHERQGAQGERKEQASGGGAVTQRLANAAVTAGLPQITRPYPLGMPSSRPTEWRSHDGAPATIPDKQRNHDLMAAADKQETRQNGGDDGQNGRKNATTTTTNVLDDLVSDGVFWSESVEAMLPAGFDEHDVTSWTAFSSNATVVKVLDGCGRMQNRMLVFDNGTRSCCRYRQNNDQIQGEIFSFYLARLLGLRNLPPASLGLLYGRDWQWTSVRGQLTLAQWSEQKPVVMTKFVDGLEPAYIPRNFRGDANVERRLHPVAEDLVAGVDRARLVELAQWSDLIVFDYLTANLDRVVNNMYNRQWNPDMMVAPAHNLAREPASGLLIFLDNESGLLHGYRLLDKYESYHRAMLQSLCVFRARTVRAVRRLLAAGDVGAQLRRTLHESQPYMTEWLPPLPDKSVKILRKRLEAVDRQVTLCERRYNVQAAAADLSGTVERYDSPVTPVTS